MDSRADEIELIHMAADLGQRVKMTTRSEMRKKARLTSCTARNQDRISSLPDALLHRILSFSDAQSAVQTSLLSKRWKFIWTTLPFLNFTRSRNFASDLKFIDNVLSRRNPDSDVLQLNLSFNYPLEYATPLVDKLTNYAISHNVQDLCVNIPGFSYLDGINISRPYHLTSTTLKKLVLKLNFGEFWIESDSCWQLPSLTTLHLIRPNYVTPYMLPHSYLLCLTSLRTLLLDGFELPNSISLPSLQTLILHVVHFPENMSEFCRVFQALGSLRNLTLFFWTTLRTDCVIDCPQLVNLEINYCTSKSGKCIVTRKSGTIRVLAPKILTFSSVGIFPIRFGVSELENVNIQLQDNAVIKNDATFMTKERFYDQVTDMFHQLNHAKILTLDTNTIEALSAISDSLVHSITPFFKLKYVKVPCGFKESSMSTYLKWFLLGRCPEAAIVTTLPRNVIPNLARAQNVVIQEPLASPTKVFDSKYIHKTVSIDTVGLGVQEQDAVENSEVHAPRVRHVAAAGGGTGNDRVSSSKGNSDFGIWRVHQVNSEFVCLLDLIMNSYPETFEHYTTKIKKFCTMELNMLCTSINDFSRISMADVDAEVIAEYRAVFAELQKYGFSVSWLESRLNYVEQLLCSHPLIPELRAIDRRIDDTTSKLQDLQTKLQDLKSVRADKMQEIQNVFGTMGANIAVGCIGDDLFSV